MADRVHPMPLPVSSPSSPPSPAPGEHHHHHAATETTPLQPQPQPQPHPSFNQPPPPSPGTYIIQMPKDQVLRVPPPDRARRYRKLASRPARRRLLRRACCLACAAVLLLVLAAAAFAGAVYLVFRPRAPSFSVASLTIRGLEAPALARAAAAAPHLSPEVDAAVRADNGRNKKVGFDYRGGGEVAISYAGASLAAGPWPAFYQAPRNVTVLSAPLRGGGISFSEEQRKQLAAEQAAGAVPLTVEATVPMRVRFGKVLRTWTVDVKATCQVTVGKLSGEEAAANRGCRVKVRPLWWWW